MLKLSLRGSAAGGDEAISNLSSANKVRLLRPVFEETRNDRNLDFLLTHITGSNLKFMRYKVNFFTYKWLIAVYNETNRVYDHKIGYNVDFVTPKKGVTPVDSIR